MLDKNYSVKVSVLSECIFSRLTVEEYQCAATWDPSTITHVVRLQKKMWKLFFASSLILLSKTCLCEMRKTIKVEKYGAPYIPAHLRLEAGDQKEVTVCLKFRTFAYKDGFHCPFAIYTGLIIL